MIPFEIELSDIKVKDLHIIILNASESLNPGQAQSFKSVNGTHFVLLHTILFRAIFNQEKKCREGFNSWANIQSMSKDTRSLLEILKATSSLKTLLWQQLGAHHFP